MHLAHPPRLLHLTTHGVYREPMGEAEDPLELARIALAGANKDFGRGDSGLLSAAEAMTLHLSGVELVVVAACETARGTASYAEGLAGLPSALAVAGARRTMLALWTVYEDSTNAFMLRFYQHLAAQPGQYEAALRATKLEAISGALKLPRLTGDWKAFVMVRN
jgi:CHAT domain-containing protein